jgi:hypothetical protein
MRGQQQTRKYDQIRQILEQDYPTLHLSEENGQWLIKGSFPVRANGKIVDHYLIAILIPRGFPQNAPLVRELGGRIKQHPDWHTYQEGFLCVFSPIERWKHLPKTATILTYLNEPLNDYLFSQTYFERYGRWPFGERGHGWAGFREYLSEELNNDDVIVLRQLLKYLSTGLVKGYWDCFCGSGKQLRHCHLEKFLDLHDKITPTEAQYALRVFDLSLKK